jgi:hypothetical protein
MSSGLLDCILTPAQGNRLPVGAVWCADNGCFGKGYPGPDAWWQWLVKLPHRERCAFAVAPDVVGDAEATLKLSAPWLPRIRGLGIPAALVAQNGLEALTVPWDTFDVLFLGGDTTWKTGEHARVLTAEARRRGKPVHMGRVSSLKRLRYADAIGCTSADGTFIAHGPDRNLPRMLRWIDDVNHQAAIGGAAW